jgi:hypothetical protein
MNEAATATVLDLLAGSFPDGRPVLEKVRALAAPDGSRYRLLQSPLFVTGVACGDLIEPLHNSPGRFRVHERSGQLAVRVLRRDGVAELEQELTPALEKLDGQLDVQSERALVYSIHVAVGFHEIEQVLDSIMMLANGATWSYGNVYDPETGEPLDWWENLLNP